MPHFVNRTSVVMRLVFWSSAEAILPERVAPLPLLQFCYVNYQHVFSKLIMITRDGTTIASALRLVYIIFLSGDMDSAETMQPGQSQCSY